ncbi:hypothetical protein TSUD_324080 [Trifolium subterraneum]|uniref:Uncharacterized protein n=1 Tax=Trifolium subterraneum TaxID=3900 RepID=A0A2Z6NFY1_TRISU|nr:hypothetical protein TSUD_324080 [Trifolium subterraneum]
MFLVVVSAVYTKETMSHQIHEFHDFFIALMFTTGLHNLTRSDFINIGALFSFNTNVGRIIKIALDVVVEDVNSDPNILGDTVKALSSRRSKYRGFLSIAEIIGRWSWLGKQKGKSWKQGGKSLKLRRWKCYYVKVGIKGTEKFDEFEEWFNYRLASYG